MDLSDNLLKQKPAGMAGEEWERRLELAACYRLFDWMGWTELIYNHITLRVPGPEKHYLINPYGLWYDEVTATNLVKVNLKGEVMGDAAYPINPAGFVIHGAVHAARDDAHCIIHTHTTSGMAVSCKAGGLRHDNFYSATLFGEVAYHDFEGITTNLGEQPRLVASLGTKRAMILRNHGLLAVGATLTEAFSTYWTLQRSCDVQMAADSMAGENIAVPQKVLDAIPEQARYFRQGKRPGGLAFDGALRRAGIRYEDLV